MAQQEEKKKDVENNMNKEYNDYDKKDTSKNFEEYMKRYQNFERNITPFPIESNSIILSDKLSPLQDDIYRHMTQTYPICHGGTLSLAYQFLLIKRKYGSEVEKALYKDMTLIQLFNRISTKRAVVFYQKYDSYMLRNGRKGASNWESVGTDFESMDSNASTPKLQDYMSYDELFLSAMCGVSSPTHFINDGDRRNNGRFDKQGGVYPMEGIYMGLIGARFEKPYVMEYSLMLVTKDQNTKDRGYGAYDEEKDPNLDRLQKAISDEYCLKQVEAAKKQNASKPPIRNVFESFYSRPHLPLYDEIKSQINNSQELSKRYFEDSRRYGQNKPFIDIEMFKRRVRISLELFLFDSDNRSKQQNKKGFCHLVGLGAGYWSFNKKFQDEEMVKVVLEIVRDSCLPNISCIYFAWFDDNAQNLNELKKQKDEFIETDKSGNKIILQFGRRNPAEPLNGAFKDNLLCACYAWDGNSFVGNEYWLGRDMLSASGDPAAAACSTISYTQNSEFNKEYVNGANTMFYFFDPTQGQYSFIKLKDIDFEKNKEKWLKKSVLSIPYKRNTINDVGNGNKNDNNKANSNL